MMQSYFVMCTCTELCRRQSTCTCNGCTVVSSVWV